MPIKTKNLISLLISNSIKYRVADKTSHKFLKKGELSILIQAKKLIKKLNIANRSSACIVIPDRTRIYPNKKLIYLLASDLKKQGYRQIFLIIAYGNHKRHSIKFLNLKGDLYKICRIVHHDSKNKKQLLKIHSGMTQARKAFLKYITGTASVKFLNKNDYKNLKIKFLKKANDSIYINKIFLNSDLSHTAVNF
jgi:nickel-dependent lactate racemase